MIIVTLIIMIRINKDNLITRLILTDGSLRRKQFQTMTTSTRSKENQTQMYNVENDKKVKTRETQKYKFHIENVQCITQNKMKKSYCRNKSILSVWYCRWEYFMYEVTKKIHKYLKTYVVVID